MTRRARKPGVMMTVTARSLVPVSMYDAEEMAKFRVGSVVECVLHQPYSPKLMRLYRWALGKVVDHTDFLSADELAEAIKIDLGYVDTINLIGGGMQVRAKSLADMDAEGLKAFVARAKDILSTKVVPGLDVEALFNEGEVIVGDEA